MPTMKGSTTDRASLESVVESGMLKVESLHPGGLSLSRELAGLCGIRKGDRVLDVASGTGETACLLAGEFGANVRGLDQADEMIRLAKAKAREQGLEVEFAKGDATHLPFGDAEFDAVICECTLCLLDKERALGEMARVVRRGGRVGMHDLCWMDDAPERLKNTLAEIEGERPESLEGWKRLFDGAGLSEIVTVDKFDAMSRWMRQSRKQLGRAGELTLTLKIIRRWGFRGLWRVLQSERVFSNKHLGYGIVVGTKR